MFAVGGSASGCICTQDLWLNVYASVYQSARTACKTVRAVSAKEVLVS